MMPVSAEQRAAWDALTPAQKDEAVALKARGVSPALAIRQAREGTQKKMDTARSVAEAETTAEIETYTPTTAEKMAATGRHMLEPLTFGLADEARGVITMLPRLAPGGEAPLDAYRRGRDAERDKVRDYATGDLGHQAAAGQLAGTFAGGIIGGRGVTQAATLGQGVRQGAGLGAAGAFGLSEADNPVDLAVDTGSGAVVGGLFAGGLGALARAPDAVRALRDRAGRLTVKEAAAVPVLGKAAAIGDLGKAPGGRSADFDALLAEQMAEPPPTISLPGGKTIPASALDDARPVKAVHSEGAAIPDVGNTRVDLPPRAGPPPVPAEPRGRSAVPPDDAPTSWFMTKDEVLQAGGVPRERAIPTEGGRVVAPTDDVTLNLAPAADAREPLRVLRLGQLEQTGARARGPETPTLRLDDVPTKAYSPEQAQQLRRAAGGPPIGNPRRVPSTFNAKREREILASLPPAERQARIDMLRRAHGTAPWQAGQLGPGARGPFKAEAREMGVDPMTGQLDPMSRPLPGSMEGARTARAELALERIERAERAKAPPMRIMKPGDESNAILPPANAVQDPSALTPERMMMIRQMLIAGVDDEAMLPALRLSGFTDEQITGMLAMRRAPR